MQFFRIREKSMTIAEMLTGARKTYVLNLIGGIRHDILKEDRLKTIKLIRKMRAEIMQLSDMLLNTLNMLQRTQGIGILSSQVARDYSPVGPMISASGFQRDMRIDHPYSAYLDLPMELAPSERRGRLFPRAGAHSRSADLLGYRGIGFGQSARRPAVDRRVYLQALSVRAGIRRSATRRRRALEHDRR